MELIRIAGGGIGGGYGVKDEKDRKDESGLRLEDSFSYAACGVKDKNW